MRRFVTKTPIFFGFFRYNSTIIESIDFQKSVEPLFNSSKKAATIFDIDNTLMLATSMQSTVKKSGYGSDIWFSNMITQMQHTPNFPALYMALVAHYCAIQAHLRYTLTEECVPNVLFELHKKKIPVIGLTARSSSIAKITISQLAALGIYFTDNSVIFCSGGNKAECFEAASQTPVLKNLLSGLEDVSYIDDNKKHCKNMHTWLMRRNYNPLVTHYRYVEEKIPIASDEELKADAKKIEELSGFRFP